MSALRPLAVSAVLLLAVACSSSPSSPTPQVTPTPTPAPTATPTPEPTPAPQLGPGSIAYIRVGFYGIDCPGRTPPNNGSKTLPVGCIGHVTATPKQTGGIDVPSDEHGADIEWDLAVGRQQVSVTNLRVKFNKDLKGKNPGPFSLCATVRTVRGCLDGNVVP
jgi:hypothetical protein